MKKIIIAAVLMLLCALLLTACSGECVHAWSSWTTVTDATCTAAGRKIRSCNNCHTSESGTIPAQGHNMVGGHCTVCGATQ